MQTRFDAAHLTDAGTAAAAGAIRKCVHCGFCTATCPTYVLLGDELDSPRGRIYLIKNMLERGTKPGPEVVKHLDRCLSCLSCETHCPSGVSYRRIIDEGRTYVEAHHRRALTDRLLRSVLARVLPFRDRMRAALALAALAQPFESFAERRAALRPLAALLHLRRVARASRARHDAISAQSPCTATGSRSQIASGGSRRIGIAGGCVGPVLDPGIEAATVRLLERAGCEVVRVAGEGCCGALSHHLGREQEARRFARLQVHAWQREIDRAPLHAIVVTTSGCAPVIRDYGHLLGEDARYRESAARVAALAKDLSEVLLSLGLRAVTSGSRRMVVAYHPACSLQHGCGVTSEPAKLLAQAGFEVRMPSEAHLCCGSAGTYNILQPDIAGQLGARKAAALAALEPDVIATGNIGCMMQIRSMSRIPVVHVAQLLDWATGGPKPIELARGTRPTAEAGSAMARR
ncbi:MAG TPA: heterodisulfide reductase-related iron-sulfur binding cluster [Steroidobacteraceae bacterium]|nr:heterodisulfide reductase-related iron-sulfur binding cluster [Steroidobacteraceae bacterium]